MKQTVIDQLRYRLHTENLSDVEREAIKDEIISLVNPILQERSKAKRASMTDEMRQQELTKLRGVLERNASTLRTCEKRQLTNRIKELEKQIDGTQQQTKDVH